MLDYPSWFWPIALKISIKKEKKKPSSRSPIDNKSSIKYNLLFLKKEKNLWEAMSACMTLGNYQSILLEELSAVFLSLPTGTRLQAELVQRRFPSCVDLPLLSENIPAPLCWDGLSPPGWAEHLRVPWAALGASLLWARAVCMLGEGEWPRAQLSHRIQIPVF